MGFRALRLEWVRAAALLALILCVAHLPVVLLGRTQQPACLSPHALAGREARRENRRPAPAFDVEMGTAAYYEWPQNRLVGRLWRHGEVPLWDAHSAAGLPLLAQYSSKVFFPYQIVEDLSPPVTWDFFLLGRAWLAGIFAWAFLRRLVKRTEPALLGGALYMLSGSFTYFLSLEQYSNVAMTSPLLLLALDRLVERPRGRAIAFAALVTALVLFGGQPEVAFCVLALGGFWTLHRAFPQGVRGVALTLGTYALASLLGLLLASPLLMPFAEFAAAAFHYHPAGGHMGVQSPTFWSVALGVFVPNLMQGPAPFVELPLNGRFDYIGGYSGVLPWVLLLAAVARGEAHRREIVFFGSTAAIVLLKDLGVAPFAWLGHLPLFDQVWSPRWAGSIWTLSLSLAAGLSAASLCDSPESPSRAAPSRRGVLIASGVTLAACVIRGAWALFNEPPALLRDALYPSMPDRHFALRATVALVIALGTAAVAHWVLTARRASPHTIAALVVLATAELMTAVPRGYGHLWLNAGVVPWALAVAASIALVSSRARLAIAMGALSAVALAAIDLASPRGLPSRFDPFVEASWVRFVRQRAGYQRVTSVGGALFPNNADAAGLFDVHFITSLAVKSFREMALWLLEPTRRPETRSWSVGLWLTGVPEASWTPNGLAPGFANIPVAERLYALFGVRYVAVPSGVRLDMPLRPADVGRLFPYRLVYRGEVDVWEHTQVMPRAWVVHELRRVPSTPALYAEMTRPETDFRRVAFLNEREARELRGDDGPPTAEEGARITSYRANTVTLEARASRPGLVVLSDVMSDGWTAEVDGHPTSIVTVNGCLRGVWIPAGEHRVVERYEPETFNIGVLCASVGALLCVFLARPRRDAQAPSAASS